jgi:methionine synthase I (cobalamin-dependent)
MNANENKTMTMKANTTVTKLQAEYDKLTYVIIEAEVSLLEARETLLDAKNRVDAARAAFEAWSMETAIALTSHIKG